MTFNIQGVIQAMVRAQDLEPDADQGGKPVITISRTMGSGGNEIANLLAKRLGVQHFGREVLDAIAKQTQVNPSLMNKLHESVASASDAWLYSVVFGKKVSRDDYQRHLVTATRALYKMGGVIVGRGGHIILAGRDVLRVRIIGSPEVCAKRIAVQEQKDYADALAMVKESNKKRSSFIKEQFSHKSDDPLDFDLVINTDHFASYEQVVDLLEQAVKSLCKSGTVTGTTQK
ncbi:cytidylate kinase-like family protein [Magnetospira thiophila]